MVRYRGLVEALGPFVFWSFVGLFCSFVGLFCSGEDADIWGMSIGFLVMSWYLKLSCTVNSGAGCAGVCGSMSHVS